MKNDKVVLIGLDACDPALAQRFASKGVMPNLARLLKTSARAPVINPFGLFVGSLWVNFATALRPDRHGFHCWDQIDPNTYEYRLNTPNITHLPQFWTGISNAGGRVAVIDVPHMVANQPLNGFQVVEWGVHDRHHGLHSSPPEMARMLEARFGHHPALSGPEAYGARDFAPDDECHRSGRLRSREENCALLQDMLAGVRTKNKIINTLLNEDEWDLFLAVFGESHAIGHQQWHLHDESHPDYDAETVAAMGGDPLAQVYAELDSALGEIETQIGPETLLMVHLSHGMGPHFSGGHLLDEVLARIDRHRSQSVQVPPRTSPTRQAMSVFIPALQRLARILKIPPALRSRLGSTIVTWPPTAAEARATRRYFLEPNNTVYGGIRLNLIGREPQGRVSPEEVDALIAELEEDLLELVNVETGNRVVRSIDRCDRWHRRAATDTMPDLFVDWERSDQINTVTSPKIGVVHSPYDHWRTGDHHPAGLLLARGPGLPAGERMPSLAVEDIGPSIAARLGVKLEGVDGRVHAWLELTS